jgi:radical SAM protein with 4Fe4S-binding SPASM domain
MRWLDLQAALFRSLVAVYHRVAPQVSRFVKIPPLRLTVVLTNKCNLSCAHCFQKDQLNQKVEGQMTTDEWLEVIESVSRFTVVDLIGGEAFLHRDLGKILEACRRRGLLVSITTNATLLTDQAIEAILDAKVHYLMISVDGLGREHDLYRGRPGLFDKIMDSIQRIQKAKKARGRLRPFISIKTLLMDGTLVAMPDFIDHFEKIEGVDELKFHFPTLNKLWNSLDPVDDLDFVFKRQAEQYEFSPEAARVFKERLPELERRMRSTRLRVSIGPKLPRLSDYVDYVADNSGFRAGACGEPISNFSILPNGDMIPCLSYRIGNIRSAGMDVNSVLFSPNHRNFIARQSQDRSSNACLSCTMKSHSRH